MYRIPLGYIWSKSDDLLMGIFDTNDDVHLENADLNCEPQNEFANEKEVAKIDEYLDPGEKVHFLARSEGERFEVDGETVDDTLAQRTAVTDKRIVIKKKKNPFGYDSQTIRYDNISSVDLRFGMMMKRLNIETSSKVYGIGIGKLSKDACREMTRFIRMKASEVQKSESVNQNSSSSDPIDKLERLRDLNNEGVLTDEEFNEKKKELLEQI
ncbi:PH domain-containing protein [Natrialbaceae archaeon A-CW1-1]